LDECAGDIVLQLGKMLCQSATPNYGDITALIDANAIALADKFVQLAAYRRELQTLSADADRAPVYLD
jgi:hypothetical protein